jgi:hypothetical protein
MLLHRRIWVERIGDSYQSPGLFRGWVPERSIGHAWRACVPQGTAGSNPAPSANFLMRSPAVD